MLGGQPTSTQFKNVHPGRTRQVDGSTGQLADYNTSLLEGHDNRHDDEIYALADSIFEANWLKYRDRLPQHRTCQALLSSTPQAVSTHVVPVVAARSVEAVQQHQALLDETFAPEKAEAGTRGKWAWWRGG